MAKSMTGFGRCELQDGERRFTVEMKSVNNRYLDLNIRLPRQLNPYEAEIRSILKSRIARGKVDVFISLEEPEGSHAKVVYHQALAGEYLEALRRIAAEFELPLAVSAEQLSRYPDVLSLEEGDAEEADLLTPLKSCVEQAVDQFVAAREKEGAFITKDILGKLDEMQEGVDRITANAPGIIEQYRSDLYARMREVLEDAQIDEGRILQEAAIYSDKVCVDEELVRLRSHILAVRAELQKENESVGRKLDFLAQEMNREANTILSKTSNSSSADIAIDLKTGIEKIREQVQNIE